MLFFFVFLTLVKHPEEEQLQAYTKLSSLRTVALNISGNGTIIKN